jgi:hypothetical protein
MPRLCFADEVDVSACWRLYLYRNIFFDKSVEGWGFDFQTKAQLARWYAPHARTAELTTGLTPISCARGAVVGMFTLQK